MQITGTDIQMTRGDTERIVVRMTRDGERVPFEAGATLYFTVKRSLYEQDEDKLIGKTVTAFSGGEAVVQIDPDDTKSLSFGTYYYDIQYTSADGEVTTIVPASAFELLPEVTYE